ncbi:MAG: YebC/PmpR family DNA-binding transcriptional regulator [Clostridiales bacterium]|jgi:YebC/PmpR family DNA-binding regulatory protein|nr:YebC/PmpR family DNA-binding transcriptional regulator [Clostridiales bacterium]
MSGHSKWANIKRKKEESDSKRGKIFTKLGRELAVVVKQGGPDPVSNSKLKDVIAKAKAENMPNDNIMRSIKKAAGDQDGANYEEITYEGYGPGGVAVIVETMTDNKNRTAGDVRHLFDKYGGNMGTSGCVSFLFNRKGLIVVLKETRPNEDAVMMEALEAGAEDIVSQEDVYEITTTPEGFSAVREALEKDGYEFEEADIEMIPVTTVSLTDPKQVESLEKLVDSLDDLDDVQNVFHNWEESE